MLDLPAGTVTLQFADIEGSTRLIQRLGDRYAAVLAEYRRLLHDAVEARGVQELNTWGDAVFAAFSSLADAVATGVRAQQALAGHQWPEGTALRARIHRARLF